MAQRYYIDGYNVLHKSRALRPLARQSLESAREALIDRIAEFCSQYGAPCWLVFDGRTEQRAVEADHGRRVAALRVIYTAGASSADSWIEREVYKAGDRLNLVVVSNDGGIRNLVRGLGALTMDADHFIATIGAVRREIGETLQRRDKPEALGTIEGRVGAETLARLAELKKRLGP